ncbi:MAG TPA: Pycsar system effector family protein [Dongiaceae bacterium]|nr:Pycsar system effector family protein [Dongiaceae bacterium]
MSADSIAAEEAVGQSLDGKQRDAFERILSANLSRIVDLIKFAETKNAALLTFSAFWILALINLLASGRELPSGFVGAFLVALPLFASSAFVCVLAFVPKIDIQHRQTRGRAPAQTGDQNLLFFSDIARVPFAGYEAAARARYFSEPTAAPSAAYIRDLAREVAVNARIADRKFRLFHWAACIMSIAIAVLVAPGLWHLVMWIAG